MYLGETAHIRLEQGEKLRKKIFKGTVFAIAGEITQ